MANLFLFPNPFLFFVVFILGREAIQLENIRWEFYKVACFQRLNVEYECWHKCILIHLVVPEVSVRTG